jgi:hypothetical protein
MLRTTVVLTGFVLVACGEQRHNDTGVDTTSAVVDAPSATVVGSGMADAVTKISKPCAVDLLSSISTDAASGTRSFRFSRFLAAECVGVGRKVELLVRYPAAAFSYGSSLVCVLLRTAEDVARYGDFNFRCTGAALTLPAGASTFFVDIPAVESLDPASIKMSLRVE